MSDNHNGSVILTDPQPIPRSRVCPQCGAGFDKRVQSDTIGEWTWPMCRECGAEFPDEKRLRNAV